MHSLLHTHPLQERIQRIDRTYVVKKSTLRARPLSNPLSEAGQVLAFSSSSLPSNVSQEWHERPTPDSIIQQIGASQPHHVTYIHDLLTKLPECVQKAVHEPYGARAVVYALLLSQNPKKRKAQKNRLKSHADACVHREVLKLESIIVNLDPALRLPLVDMAIPTLKNLSPKQYETFKSNFVTLLPQKDQDGLFGWAFQRILFRHLDPYFSNSTKFPTRYHSLSRVAHHCGDLLSALAHHGNSNSDKIMQAFRAGKQELGVPALTLTPASQCTQASLDLTLYTLAAATPQLKRTIVKACAACVLADQHVTVEEGELLRAIADSLGCPMPPLFATLSKDLPPSLQHSAQTLTSHHGVTDDHPRRYAQVH